MEENILLRDGFEPDMTLEVLTDTNTPLFVGRITAIEADGSVTVKGDGGSRLPPGKEGTKVRLRAQRPNAMPAIYSGMITLGSFIFWKIKLLEGGVIRNRRAFYRQTVDEEAFVMLFARADGSEDVSGVPAMCDILDISGGGLRMRCGEKFQIGDRLLVMEVNLLGENFDFGCQVCRVEEVEDTFGYGCQFEGISDQDQSRLINVINQLQRRN